MTEEQTTDAGTRMSEVIDRLDRAREVAADARRKAVEQGFSETVAEGMGVGAYQLMLASDTLAQPCDCPRCTAKREAIVSESSKAQWTRWPWHWTAFVLAVEHVHVLFAGRQLEKQAWGWLAADVVLAAAFFGLAWLFYKRWRP